MSSKGKWDKREKKNVLVLYKLERTGPCFCLRSYVGIIISVCSVFIPQKPNKEKILLYQLESGSSKQLDGEKPEACILVCHCS